MVNIPKALADVRLETYSHFTTPSSLSGLYKNQGVAFALASTLALMMITSLVIYSLAGSLDKLFQATTDRSLFYEITSHGFLVSLFLPVFGLSILMMARSGHKYWKALTTLPAESTQIVSEAQSTFLDATTLRYLGGGGDGCPSENDHPSMRRRFSHQLIFYGFLLCLLSTSVATAYHYLLNWPAPYPMLSVPKVLGTVGGVMMVLGCSLTALNRRSRHTSLKSPDQRSLDIGFVTVLFLVAFSGLLSMLFRATAAMPLLHIFHLSTVMTFFLLMPYSKFMHSTYRLLALWWHNREQLNSRDTHLHES
jgi:citrate/tricarballylate utilization protein